MVNFVFADSSETKSVIENSLSETSDLKYGEDPRLQPHWILDEKLTINLQSTKHSSLIVYFHNKFEMNNFIFLMQSG